MLKRIVILSLIIIFMTGCEEMDFHTVNNKYPTIYKCLSDENLSVIRNEYFQRNPYIGSTLSNFGFCNIGYRGAPNPINTNTVNSEEAICIVKDFILKNMNETGISSIDNIAFKEIREFTLDSNYTSHWYLTVKEQTIDTIVVLNSTVGFRVINGEVVSCANNWYPEIYIPKVFDFDSEKAKSILVNKVVTHLGPVGEYKVTIKQENIVESKVRLVIYPVKTDEKIELRVSWEIYIPSPVYFQIYIDVMTGDIIAEEPTIVA